jgi:hypothetical protein
MPPYSSQSSLTICVSWNPSLMMMPSQYLLSRLYVQLLGSMVASAGLHLSVCLWMVIVAASLAPLTWLGTPKGFTHPNQTKI